MPTISLATSRNWSRLNAKTDGRLTSRANKTESKKKIEAKMYGNMELDKTIIDKISLIKSPVGDIMFSLCNLALKANQLANKKHVKSFMQQFIAYFHDCKVSINTNIFYHKADILGYIYQSLLDEGERNKLGIYYTATKQVQIAIKDIIVGKQQTFLDPCCGSGSFLLNVRAESPESLYGFDIDPIAVMIAGVNLMIRYADCEFQPHIYQYDFLNRNLFGNSNYPVSVEQFDYIFTNPPWGADRIGQYHSDYSEIKSTEKASMFIVESIKRLNATGKAGFILPKAMLTVASHSDIRKFLLNRTSIQRIVEFDARFDGVFTGFFSIEVNKIYSAQQSYVVEHVSDTTVTSSCSVKINGFDSTIPLAPPNRIADKILSKVEAKKFDSLSHSKWALGIVTGNNKQKLHDEPSENYEPIYTGKQVSPFKLEKAVRFVNFNPKEFQQCAPEAIYRAPEKLIYRFIAKYPVVSYDNSGALTLNSANIVVPEIATFSVKSVCAVLNSTLYRFLYLEKNNDIKVLKANMMSLPFPRLTTSQNQHLSQICDKALATGFNKEIRTELDLLVYSLFDIDSQEKSYIEFQLSK